MSSSDIGFYSDDISLCRLDINVDNGKTVSGSVGFFKLE